MFAPNQGFNPVGERLLVLTLAAGLTRAQPTRRLWPWSRRPAQKPVEAASPIDAQTPDHAAEPRGDQLAPSRL